MTSTETNATGELTIPADLRLCMQRLHENGPPVENDEDPKGEWRTIHLGWDADGNGIDILYNGKSMYLIESGLIPVNEDYFKFDQLLGLESFIERFRVHCATIAEPSHWWAIIEGD